MSQIWDCNFKDKLTSLEQDYTVDGKVLEGWCNCNRCPESNASVADSCPKETEHCYYRGVDWGENKTRELCKAPGCQTCEDICADRHQCLDMKNRRDVVYFGVDEYDDPLLTYYDCKDGYCKEIYDLKCTRTCDAHQFDFSRANFALLQGERILMSQCDRLTVKTGTGYQTMSSSRYDSILASCSNITYNSYDDDSKKGFIEAHDCVNGTWFSKNVLSRTDYETLLVEYERYRSDRSRLVVDSSGENLIPLETDITILNDTKIMKNQEGCVNTLSMECMDFYYRYGRDGANYTSRAIFDCYYNEHDNSSVVLDYQPQRTLFFLLFWSMIPGAIMFVSCVYMCVCSKFMFIGDDGHMRIFCCGKAVTGIGEVAVYKPPLKTKS